MAKAIFIGNNSNIAKKAKKLYIGNSSNIAKKIKKMYIGDSNNIARLFFAGSSNTVVQYTGASLSLNEGRLAAATATAGIYALFAGGIIPSDGIATLNTVEGFSSSLTRVSVPNLSSDRGRMTGITINSIAVFFNGNRITGVYPGIECYNPSLTKFHANASTSDSKYSVGATNVGNYIVVAGGITSDNFSYSNTVDAFDSAVTRVATNTLISGTSQHMTANTGNYAIIAGGQLGNSDGSYSSRVEAFSESLVKVSSVTQLSKIIFAGNSCSVGGYALFTGGIYSRYDSSNSKNDLVYVYNSSLTQTFATPLTVPKTGMGAITLGECAIFVGGLPSRGNTNLVEVYDASLTKTTSTVTNPRYNLISAVTGDYALFTMGESYGVSVDSKIIDIITFA